MTPQEISSIIDSGAYIIIAFYAIKRLDSTLDIFQKVHLEMVTHVKVLEERLNNLINIMQERNTLINVLEAMVDDRRKNKEI